jgi:acetylornithine/succinyldiaminopimelate/putrescine aminotransferase
MNARRRNALRLYARHVSEGKARFYRRYRIDLVPGLREGLYLEDLSGKRFMNCHCNGGTFNYGHCNAELAAVLKEALKRNDVGSLFAHGTGRAAVAERLAALMPGDINRVLLCTGASEAVDAALKAAMRATGRRKVISEIGGYHGCGGLATATGAPAFREPFGPPIPGFVQVPFNDAAALERAVDTETAAVILETIPATLGMPIPSDDYLPRVRAACDRHGAMLILDEVQAGLGRTGKLWAFEHWGIVPDAVIIGKGLSGGLYPIAAACFRPALAAAFEMEPFLHFTEYGGSDVGCAVALAVLERSAAAATLEHVNRLAEWFRVEFGALQRKYGDCIAEVRQKGLFFGIAYRDKAACVLMLKILFDLGLYTVYAGNNNRVMQFIPPLNVTEVQAREIMAVLHKAFEARRKPRYRIIAAFLRFTSGPG